MKDKGGLGIADGSHWIPVGGLLQSGEASRGMKYSRIPELSPCFASY